MKVYLRAGMRNSLEAFGGSFPDWIHALRVMAGDIPADLEKRDTATADAYVAANSMVWHLERIRRVLGSNYVSPESVEVVGFHAQKAGQLAVALQRSRPFKFALSDSRFWGMRDAR